AVADGWLNSISPENENAKDFLTFRLVRITASGAEEEICGNGNRSQWNYYFNQYMPVGKYAVTIEVKPLSMNGNCVLWWGASVNSQAVYQGVKHTYEFEVTPAVLEICDAEFNLTPLNVTDFEEKGFAAIVSEIVGTVGVQPDSTSIFGEAEIRSRGGYWADYAEQYYDYEPKLAYNLSRFYSNEYFAAEEREDWNDYLATPATHRIFYNVEMKNYVWNVDMALHKYEYYFDLVVYEELAAPTLQNGGVFVYTGAPISAAPTDTSAEYLSKFTIRNGTATDSGDDYTVTFRLKDAEHYKWSNRELGAAECNIPYVIQKAKVRVPQSGSAVYTGEPLSPFEIPNDIHGNPVYRIVGEVQPVFVDAEEYEIELQLTDTGNYEWITADGSDQVTGSVDGSIQITFTIRAAADLWTQSLRVNGWQYRDFRPAVNFFAAALASGKTVKYAVTTDPDDESAVIADLNGFSLVGSALPAAAETAFVGLDRGTYYICAYTDEWDNYAPANSGWISFEVTQANNEWVSEPRADGWEWGSYNAGTVVINGGQAKFGTVSVVYYRLGLDGTPTGEGHASLTDFDAENAGSYIGIPAGNYRMAVTVEATENYTGFAETREIRVEKAENRWEVTPNIQSWIYGNAPAISGEARFGDVNLTITFGGTVIYNGSLNAAASEQSLRTARPGEYEFSATVALSGNWYGLVYNGGFRISSPNNNGWLIAPSIANWTEGETPNDGDALPIFNAGNMQRWYETDDGDLLAAKPETAGDYYFVVHVPAYTDESGITYDELTARVRFTVYSKPIALNGWKVAPNIQGWREGDTPNEPVGEADAGSVVFTYRTADGTELDAKPATAGSYVLIASVKAEGYADLTAEVRFTIAVAPVTINQTAQDSTGSPVYITIDGVRAGYSVTFDEIANNDANAGFWKRTSETFADLGYAVGAVYNITLTDANGAAVQPDGTVTVTLSVPRWMQSKGGLQIACLNELGSVELMGGVVSGDKITFTATHFSNYCFVWAEASGNDAAETGWAIFLTVIVEICVVAALATTVAVFVVVWKRKKAAAGAESELKAEPSVKEKRANKVAEKQS
ncbi:MAG: hypothetical protein K2H43_04155, partial [Clostridia bacterium]|nr:hypothetical protein [Clostridia bacterium]